MTGGLAFPFLAETHPVFTKKIPRLAASHVSHG
jgi:hypothetical protein